MAKAAWDQAGGVWLGCFGVLDQVPQELRPVGLGPWGWLGIPWRAVGAEQLVAALLVCLAEELGWKLPACAITSRGVWTFTWGGGKGPCREKG